MIQFVVFNGDQHFCSRVWLTIEIILYKVYDVICSSLVNSFSYYYLKIWNQILKITS